MISEQMNQGQHSNLCFRKAQHRHTGTLGEMIERLLASVTVALITVESYKFYLRLLEK